MLINTVFTCLQSLFTNKCLSKQNVYKHRVCLLTCLFTKKNEARVCLLVCLRKSGVFVYLFVYYRNRKLCLFTCLFTYIFEVNTLVNISVYKHPNLVNTPILFINSTPWFFDPQRRLRPNGHPLVRMGYACGHPMQYQWEPRDP